jgi:hypothetical protein
MSDATDRLEITELLNRHQIYIDLADAERYAGLYAPDGAYESPFASATAEPTSPRCSAAWVPPASRQTSDTSPALA